MDDYICPDPIKSYDVKLRKKMEWISVKEKLSKLINCGQKENPSSHPVLMTDGKNIQVGRRWKLGVKDYFLPDCREDFDKVTHWMPLPRLPDE